MGNRLRIDLVRHADAGDRDAWTQPDAARPLSDKGVRQAAALVAQLSPSAATRVVSSPARRCRQTLEPLAQSLGCEIADDVRLAEGGSVRAARDLIEGATSDLLLCSHGDVIGGLIWALADEGLADENARFQKASTWRLTCDGGQIIEATYIAPPAV